MSLEDPTTTKGAIEECLDDINTFAATLERFSPATIAIAMSVHLQTMLCALVECELCSAEQVRGFMQQLERDVCAEIRDENQRGQPAADLTRPEPVAQSTRCA